MPATKRTFILFSVFSLCTLLGAESFRVRKSHIIDLNAEASEEQNEECNINDAIAVFLPKDRTFIEGVEIRITIPEEVASWRNTVAATVYDKVSPVPSAKQIDYSGTRVFVNTLPGRLSWVLQVPLKKDHSIKENQYSTRTEPVLNPVNDSIFLRFQPVMKGMPEEVLNSKLSISARPILSDKGRLLLKLDFPEQASLVSAFIDDKACDLSKDIFLTPGVHNLSVISENYRNELRTFYIEQAKNTTLTVELRDVAPTLLITAPEGTKVFLDDAVCKEIGKEFVISEGEHTVKFAIGSYEIVRSITATKGKTYTATLDVDLKISDGDE